jgi:hypothetical protein
MLAPGPGRADLGYAVHAFAIDLDRLRDALDRLRAARGAGLGDGYALERLCGDVGARLPTRAWSAMHLDVFADVDAALAAQGLPVTLAPRFEAAPPVALPPIDDFPMIGHVSAQEVASLRAELAGVDLDRAGEAGELIGEFQAWLGEAATRGLALIFFYY